MRPPTARTVMILLLLGLGFIGVWLTTQVTAVPDIRSGEVQFASGGVRPADFARVTAPRAFSFPEDHGPHPAFRTEWWYFTGNLFAQGGSHFGYQLTLFRTGLAPHAGERASALATDQIYFAHFALSRPNGAYDSFERYSRGAAGLAGSSASPPEFWLENWSVRALDDVGDAFSLSASQGELTLDLLLTSLKPVVAQGEAGMSRKGPEAGNASYYVSQTRLATEGTVGEGGRMWQVEGTSWFDHEWGTTVLPPQVVGWDWFGLQLDDDRELMLYRIRRADGSFASVSAGTLVEPDGSTIHLTAEDFAIESTAEWRSPRSGATYPSGWRIRVPTAGLDLEVKPYQADQEVDAQIVYWEGAVRVMGRSRGAEVLGVGFVELTGYAEAMQGWF
ncbi:MAG: lipocalin-like domain-containing protein [Anaerolineales bacterium]